MTENEALTFPCLAWRDPFRGVRRQALPSGTFRVGSRPGSDLRIQSPVVQSWHFYLEVSAAGVTGMNQASRNGARIQGEWLNGQRVHHGDWISFGSLFAVVLMEHEDEDLLEEIRSQSLPVRKDIRLVLRSLQPRFNDDVMGTFVDRSSHESYPLENCPLKLEFRCPNNWRDLVPVIGDGRRYCPECDQGVSFATTVDEARDHAAEGRCMAVPRTLAAKLGVSDDD